MKSGGTNQILVCYSQFESVKFKQQLKTLLTLLFASLFHKNVILH